MENKIIEELILEFNKEIKEKSQVVYILSLIRKLIESGPKSKHQFLKFYCNWALHIKIDDTEIIKDKLENENIHEIYTWAHFRNVLNDFLQEKVPQINFFDNENLRNQLIDILPKIYVNTPLIVKTVNFEEIIFTEILRDGNMHHAGYTRRKIN